MTVALITMAMHFDEGRLSVKRYVRALRTHSERIKGQATAHFGHAFHEKQNLHVGEDSHKK